MAAGKKRKQINGKWQCNICREWKAPSDFSKCSWSFNGLKWRCKICDSFYSKSRWKKNRKKLNKNAKLKWRKKSVGEQTASNFKSKWGLVLNPETINKLYLNQNGKCAICGNGNVGRKTKLLSLDYNHKTGKIRAFLCHKCNSAIAYLDESPKLLKKAAKYLEEYK